MPAPLDHHFTRRHAGIVVPVFSLRSATDWGVGEIPDVAGLCRWLAAAGQGSLHTLPLLERGVAERSPYGGLSAFAIDPVYVGLDAVGDFGAAGGRAALSPADRDAIARLRADPAIDYDEVRALKRRALEMGFAAFARRGDTAALASFREEEASWLDDYVLYRALREAHGETCWTAWPEPLRRRDQGALRAAGEQLAGRMHFHAWVQWVAHGQWREARRAANALGVRLVGDAPFTVAVDSADLWSAQDEFDVQASIGAPPDAFNAHGQDWELPAFRWDVVRGGGYRWLRERLRYAGRTVDGLRLDHVVGYFRTHLRPQAGQPARFDPADEGAQRALGAAALDAVVANRGAVDVIAEDLGDVPDYVREAMDARGLPGYRVLRWEADGPVYRDPLAFPSCSVATSGTHDTSSLATWWEDELDDDARRRVAEVPAFAPLRDASHVVTPAVHEALVDGLYAAASDVALLVAQDVHAGKERINTPATVGTHNWGYRLPWTVEELDGMAGRERAAWLRAIAMRRGRSG